MIVLTVVFTACPEYDTLAGMGKRASEDFCKCYKNNSKEDCLKQMEDKYTDKEYTYDLFIEAFNKASTCGIELYKQEPSSSASSESKNRAKEFSIGVK